MQLKTVKTTADLPIRGVELVKIDSSIREVIVAGKLHIRSDYGLTVSVRVEGVEASRQKVTAMLEGFGEKVEYFESTYEADNAKFRYEELGAKVEKTTVTVLLNELGEVVGEGKVAATPVEDFAF